MSTLTRDQRRSRRRHATRVRTITRRALERGAVHVEAALFPERPGLDYRRPQTRGECLEGRRPCPFVSCAHHLALDVTAKGGIRLAFPDVDVWELRETCALDVADRGELSAAGVAPLVNLTRERVRQIEVKAKRAAREVA